MQGDTGASAGTESGPSTRLVVADMDGTLLDPHGCVPGELWPVLERLRANGVVFAVASGRQYPTLRTYFQPAPEGIAYIAENGAYVVRDGIEISANPLHAEAVRKAVRDVRVVAAEHDLGAVWCARGRAYVERRDPAFVREVAEFYKSLELVGDLLEVEDEAIKIAVYDFGDAEAGSAPILRELSRPEKLVVSTPHWLDIMDPRANKGVALVDLQAALGVTADETVVFGDYPNDLEMMAAATHSFAMANSHPEVLQRAEYTAPSNADHGVVTVLSELLESRHW